MANDFFTASGNPATASQGSSATMRAEFESIEDGFDKLPVLTGNGGKVVVVNSGGTALESVTTTGTGSAVRATSPTLVTPVLGVATATSINGTSIPNSATLLASGGALGTPSSGTLSNCTGLPVATGISGLGSNVSNFLATPSSANLAAAVTNETGTGALVFANTPTLVTPILGTPTSGALSNCTDLPVSTGVSGLGTNVATALAVNVGSSGAFVTNGGALGTPSSGTVTNLTGTASININGTVGATTPNTGAFTTLSANGDFTISGSARRILGDFSNATLSNRTIFQTSTSDSGSGVFVIPNGTGNASDLVLCSSSDPSNTSYLLLSNQTALGGRSAIESGKSGTGTYYPLVFVTNNAEAMRITTSNEVYIGGTTDQGAYNLQVSGTGVWGAGVYVNGSDARIKENVVALQSGLDVVTKLNPVTFQYKSSWSKDTSVQPGFIAQELQTALAGKDYVDGVIKDGGQYLSVSYQTLIPILAKAIQELKAEFDAYKAAHP